VHHYYSCRLDFLIRHCPFCFLFKQRRSTPRSAFTIMSLYEPTASFAVYFANFFDIRVYLLFCFWTLFADSLCNFFCWEDLKHWLKVNGRWILGAFRGFLLCMPFLFLLKMFKS
jgi:hypothetical protein